MRLRHIKGCEDFITDAKECLREGEAIALNGKIQDIFDIRRPLQIEIGMGKGQFIRNMALKNPDINFIGIERYESVLMKAIQRKRNLESDKAIDNLRFDNLRFLCADARKLADIFETGEVDKIFLNFSDPWPKDRHANRRLTSQSFLQIYDRILKPEGVIEFKTDNVGLFEYSLEVVKDSKWKLDFCSFDFHSEKESEGNIMTEYEEKFSGQGNKICKMIISR